MHKRYDIIYLTIAESFLGNLRDIIIYFILRKKLSKTIIHLLGGAGMKNILKPSKKIQFLINQYYIKLLGAVIVEGQAQANSFLNIITDKKIHIIPNFAEDFLFADENAIRKKFENTVTLKILFLSNMLFGKGHIELLEAYLSLNKEIRRNIQLDFAGSFENIADKTEFLQKIQNEENIIYHGAVMGQKKKDLFHQAHVFCLPTYYPYEGQPFSIVEAMASGCAVVTTNHSGIGNIFKDKINGFEVEKKSVKSIIKVIKEVKEHRQLLLEFAINNYNQTKVKHTKSAFLSNINSIFEGI
jgi:glycosyltransferase involved in cell wall biosynthesis